MGGYVAFLRAINVAGHATVKMTDLARAFGSAGCANVQTCIQSGNVLFDAPDRTTNAVFREVRIQLRKLIGEEPTILFRSATELDRLSRNSLFREFIADPKVKLYVAFLSHKPARRPSFPLVSAKEALEVIGIKNLEVFIVSRRKKNGFYGFPNNFIEKELGVAATSRNWSTITKIAALSSSRMRG